MAIKEPRDVRIDLIFMEELQAKLEKRGTYLQRLVGGDFT